MITLSDVAKKANVSKMTVSRVINHPEQVTDELKQLVFAAMKDLDYRPNVAAKALANNRSQVIKFFILEDIDTTEPYYMNLLFGIAKGLDEKQYALQLVTSRNYDLGNSDGYIITGARAKDQEWLDRLEKPAVVFGENRYGYDFVDTDNKQGTTMATEYAIAKNYQSLVFIGIDVKEAFEYSREAGFINTMQQHQMIPKIYRMANHSHLSEQFINDNWQKFARNTAFICASDRLAIGIVRGLAHHDAAIPNDFGVFGFDGVFLDQVSNPKLATVKQPIQELGRLCARMLLQKIAQSGSPQGELLVTPELVIRDSMRK
ncbi:MULTISPECIES: LacI family DNA-binding transcriptional regulator [Lacticaseibacillus]|uniref:LacI family DNA-binding transcriptional regulator n=1 Tax=Lacticaseibacillus yichunensis TaxID=2486015 RepID=A0ABW4CPV8_9LACO|nr:MULTISPECIES: LacI family DNA-binding transcriptional regulator [Lacticaseibacillus]